MYLATVTEEGDVIRFKMHGAATDETGQVVARSVSAEEVELVQTRLQWHGQNLDLLDLEIASC